MLPVNLKRRVTVLVLLGAPASLLLLAVGGLQLWEPEAGSSGLLRQPQEPHEAQRQRPYTLLPWTLFGAAVGGVDLSSPLPADTIEQLRSDLLRHRLLLFRGQQNVSEGRHREIAGWWRGRGGSIKFLNVSNTQGVGVRGAGADGWHVDGAFKESGPDIVSLYHMLQATPGGGTMFAPLRELVSSLTPSQRARWELLWTYDSSYEGWVPPLRPLIYSHPFTGETTMCIYMDVPHRFTWDAGSPAQRDLAPAEERLLRQEILEVFDSARHSGLVYTHSWRGGDFIMTDNPSLAHVALPATQLPAEQVGIRLLRRATVEGRLLPCKACRGAGRPPAGQA